MRVPVCPPHGTYWHFQYGWDVLSNVSRPARLAAAGGLSLAGIMALAYSESVALRLFAVAWWAATIVTLLAFIMSGIAQTIRSSHTIYKLRNYDEAVLYVGRTVDWYERYDAHTDPEAIQDEPWRRYIDDVNSGPFRWCLTPWGEWASERYRIHQTATLAKVKLAPRLHNNQLNRPYRSPFALVAILLWLAESLWFGRKRTPVSDNLEHATGPASDGEWVEPDDDDPDQPADVDGPANVDSDTPQGDGRAPFVATYVRPIGRPTFPPSDFPDDGIWEPIWEASPLGDGQGGAIPTPAQQGGKTTDNDKGHHSAPDPDGSTHDEAGRDGGGVGPAGLVLPFAVGLDGACERLSEGAAGGGPTCIECDRPRADGKARCVEHYRRWERERKARRKASA